MLPSFAQDMARRMGVEGVVQEFPDQEGVFWGQFAQAATPGSFCSCWLALQCQMIDGVLGGLLLLGKADEGPYTPIAVWPDPKRRMQHLTAAAEQALVERRGLFLRGGDRTEGARVAPASSHVALPIEVSGRVHGVVVLDVRSRPDPQLQAVLRQLYWGAAWLELFFRRKSEGEASKHRERLMVVLDLVASCVEQSRFRAAATAFVTEGAGRLGCERVSFGLLRGKRVQVLALSHSADFGKQMNLLRAIGSAMEEAIDQRAVIVYPEAPGAEPFVNRAHAELARQHGTGAICTIPMTHNGVCAGALTLERDGDRPFDPSTLEMCESLASLVGPILEDKRKEDRWLITKAVLALGDQGRRLVGPRHLGRKLIALVLAGLMAFFSMATVDYRVAADSVLEGGVQRAVVAPFNGYLLEANVRAGDLVREGQVLSALDDRDLTLERVKWASQRDQLTKKYREALAQHDRAQIRIVRAQMDQADAQISLLDEQLSRTRIVAPFDGLVVSGDLSQSLGAPVERGEVLFELAPLDEYRVVLEADERDISAVKIGQKGELLLTAMPDTVLALVVEKITPVSTAREGRNFFRVEARLEEISERLRPGMEGVSKILIDRRKLIWVWTHEAIDWFRLWVWSWWP